MDCLVGADHLAHATEPSAVEMLKPAVRASLGMNETRNDNPPFIGTVPFLKDMIRADHRAEVAPFATAFIDFEIHGV